jgi:hypothetical protein
MKPVEIDDACRPLAGPPLIATWPRTPPTSPNRVIPPVPVWQLVISAPKRLRGMLADRPRPVAALTTIFLTEIEWRLLTTSAGTADADMLAWDYSGFSVDPSVRIALLNRDVPSYCQSLEHLLRDCARPPFALERLSVGEEVPLDWSAEQCPLARAAAQISRCRGRWKGHSALGPASRTETPRRPRAPSRDRFAAPPRGITPRRRCGAHDAALQSIP